MILHLLLLFMGEVVINEMSGATVVVEKDDGYQATYFYKFFQRQPTQETIDARCRSPNLAYKFENRFDHFLFYKVNFAYDGAGSQHQHLELVGIEEGDFGQDSARERCLELLLADKDILYKTVFIRTKDSSEMEEVTTSHAGWVK